MRQRPIKILATVSLLCIGLVTSCNLNRRGTGITAPINISVEPEEFCPGEPVVIQWDAGGQIEDCVPDEDLISPASCATVNLTTDDPALDVSIGSWSLEGHQRVIPSRTTRFTLEKSFREGYTRTNPIVASATAQIWADAFSPQWELQGHCGSTGPFWDGLDIPELYGHCTTMRRVCNHSRFPITLIDDLGDTTYLEESECTWKYDGATGDLRPRLSVVADLRMDPTIYCRETALEDASPPPPITLILDPVCLPFDAEAQDCVGSSSFPLEGAGGDGDGMLFPCGDGICQIEAGESVELCPQDCGSEVGPHLTLPDEAGPPVPIVTILRDSLCWEGPGSQYPVVNSVSQGIQVEVVGISVLPDWFIIDSPRFPGVACWLSEDSVDSAAEVDFSELEIYPVPPLPEPTATMGPPVAPSNLVISNEVCNQSGYSLTFNWVDNANNEDGFNFYYNGGLIATLPPNTTIYTFTVPSSSAAEYAVEAFNVSGSSIRITVQEDGCLV